MDFTSRRTVDRATEAYEETVGFHRHGFEAVVEAQERNFRLSRKWFEKANDEFGRQVAANVAVSEELADRVLEGRKFYRTLVEDSAGAWWDLYRSQFGRFNGGLALVEEVGDEVVDATLKSVDSAAEAVVEVASDEKFPVEGYDTLNVEQVKAATESLSAAQIRTLRDHEKKNKKRETLVDYFDRKLRAQSA